MPLIDIDCKNHQGETLLMSTLKIFTEKSFEFAKYLVEKKSADVRVKDFNGHNIFHQLAMLDPFRDLSRLKFSNHKEYLQQKYTNRQLFRKFFHLFLDNGVDINERNVKGFSALSIGLTEKNRSFVELITANTDLNVDQVIDDKCELHFFRDYALETNSPQILERIISKSANFELLMQFHDVRSGFNAFHSILDWIVGSFQSETNDLKEHYAGKFKDYLRLLEKMDSGQNSEYSWVQYDGDCFEKHFYLDEYNQSGQDEAYGDESHSDSESEYGSYHWSRQSYRSDESTYSGKKFGASFDSYD